jgi:pimeloyl-ACP methyl ester carboxylesterase
MPHQLDASIDVKTIYINGKTVSYIDIGEGIPLVMIHSWPTCCKIFLASITYLNPQFRIIAPDLPGFGMSDELDTSHNYETISCWLKEFLDALNLNNIYLFGVSYGGAVALEFAHTYYPKSVSLLLLNSPEFYYYNQLELSRKAFYAVVDKFPRIKRMIYNFLIDESDWAFQIIWKHRLQNTEFVNSIKSYGKHLKFRAADETLHNFIYSDNRNLLKTISIPTLIFTGGKEDPSYLREISALSKGNPHIHYECIEGVGHSVVVENPEIFAETVNRLTKTSF